MGDLIVYFGILEFTLVALGTIAVSAWIGSLLISRSYKRNFHSLLSGFPYPALFYRGGKLYLHNVAGEAWKGSLDLKALVRDSSTSGETIVRTVPAVEGQTFQARAIHLGRQMTLLLLEDLGSAQRQQAFYRNFIQNVSHELKTPLTVIQGHAAKVMDSPEDRVGWTASLRIITDETKRLTQLVDNLLTLARLESPSFNLDRSKMSMAALLEDAILQLSDVAEERNVSLDLSLTPNLPHINADRARLKQVVLNLLDNALKYTESGGSISVRLEGDTRRNRLACVIEDTGEGIPSEDLPHIFDKLYRVHRLHGVPVEGSGLGLTLAREIIHAHGGDIKVESEVGVGSTFTFEVPIEPSSPGEGE
jgi:two-component system sensor histidine kinase VicK